MLAKYFYVIHCVKYNIR
uniref:Uncharacterized protein n=1 Tax=Anguilla anguilla TaxID=7936 RepID=A0A0E9VGL9_ANGAN